MCDEINTTNKKNEFKRLENSIEEKVATAVEVFRETLVKENEELKLEKERLRKLLNKPGIDGIPTSKTPINKDKRIPNSRIKSDKKKGGQLGHKKHKLESFSDEEVTESHIHEVTKCKCGSRSLSDLSLLKTKDEIDIDIRVQKIRHEFHQYQCNCCGVKINSPIPLNLKEDNQYGSNLKSLAVSLVNEGCVSFNRTRKLINGFTGGYVNMSEGFIVKLQKQCSMKLESFINDLKVKIINEPIVHWDDTSIDINKKRSCLRFYGTESLALFRAHEAKNKIGLDEDAILSNLKPETVVVHDHNKVNYNDEYDFANAECCVHLVRDLTKLDYDLPRKWLKDLKLLLLKTNEKRKEYKAENRCYFENVYIEEVEKKYDDILMEAREIHKNDFNKHHEIDERRLINRLLKYKNNYLMWVLRFDVPFDNNVSERALRMSKTKQKVSGQFSNITNARYYADIRSYIETCKRHNINSHDAIIRLFNDNPYTLEEIIKSH